MKAPWLRLMPVVGMVLMLVLTSCAQSSSSPETPASSQKSPALEPGHVFFTHQTQEISSPVWSADGHSFTFVERKGTASGAYLWKDNDRSLKKTISNPFASSQATIEPSPDGRHVLFVKQVGKAEMWDMVTGQKLFSFTGSQSPAWVWSPDGELLLFAAENGAAQIMKAATGKVIQTLSGNVSLSSGRFSWSPSKTQLAVSQRGVIGIWDVKTGKEIKRIQDARADNFVWASDGQTIITDSRRLRPTDPALRVWDWKNEQWLLTFTSHTTSNGPFSVRWSPDGERVLSTNWSGAIVWKEQSGKVLLSVPIETPDYRKALASEHPEAIKEAASFSPDAKLLLVNNSTKTFQVWDAVNGKLLHTYQGQALGEGKQIWSSDSKFLCGTNASGKVAIWDVKTGKETRAFELTLQYLDSTSWSPDGKMMLISKHNGGLLVLAA